MTPMLREGVLQYYQQIRHDGEVALGLASPEVLHLVNTLTLFDLLTFPKLEMGSETVLECLTDNRRVKELMSLIKMQDEEDTPKFMVILLYLYYLVRFTPESYVATQLDEKKLKMYIATLAEPSGSLSSCGFTG